MASEPPNDLDLAAASLVDRLADSTEERHRRAAAVLQSLCRPGPDTPAPLGPRRPNAARKGSL